MAYAHYWSTAYASHFVMADYRVVGQELQDALALVGCNRTTDTGQIDWATATWSTAANTVFGYELYNIMQNSLVLKITYTNRTAITASGSVPRTTVAIGTGSDGAGNLTGVIYTGTITVNNNVFLAGNKPSYVSNPASGDFFALVWKVGGVNSGGAFSPSAIGICVERLVDSAGDVDATSTGGYVITSMPTQGGATASNSQPYKGVYIPASGYTYSDNLYSCFVPGNISSSAVGTDKQPYLHYVATPRTRNTHGVCTVMATEFLPNTTFNATLIGDPAFAERGYVSVGHGLGSGALNIATANNHYCCILWEP